MGGIALNAALETLSLSGVDDVEDSPHREIGDGLKLLGDLEGELRFILAIINIFFYLFSMANYLLNNFL